jgi:PAS domain S-box-containing protein
MRRRVPRSRACTCALILVVLFGWATDGLAAGDLSFLTEAERAWLREHREGLRLCPDAEFAPVEIRNADGSLGGVAGDYIRLIEQRLGIRFEIVWHPSRVRCVEEARRGNVDLWSAVVATEKRREYMRFTEPYLRLSPAFVVSSSITEAITLEKLGDRRLVLIEGWYLIDLLERDYPHLKFTTAPTVREAMRRVSDGRADVVLTDVLEASHVLREHELPGLRIEGDAPYEAQPLSMACRRDWPILQSILDKTLARIPRIRRREILERWVSLGPERPPESSLLWVVGLLCGLLVAGAAVWAYLRWRPSRGALLGVLLRFVIPATVVSGLVWWLWPTDGPGDDGSTRAILTVEEKAWLGAHRDSLTIAPDCGFAPIEWVDSDGKFRGIAADYVALLEKRLGVDFRIVTIRDWADNVQRARNREFAIWSAVAPTPDRAEFMTFTRPYLELQAAMLVSKTGSAMAPLGDVVDETIAVVDGYFTHDYLRREHPHAQLRLVSDARAGLRAVAFREVDGFFTDLATASHLVEEDGISTLRVAEVIDTDYGLAFASRKDWPMLSRILQKGLDAISEDEHRAIRERWIRYETSESSMVGRWLAVLLAGIGFVVLIVGWNVSLQFRVRQRTRQLKDREARYRAIFEHANDGVILMLADRFVDCNDMALEIFRTTRDEFVGQSPQKFSPKTQPGGEVTIDKVFRLVELVLAGTPQVFEWRHVRLDGSQFDVDVSLSSMEFDGVPHLLAIVRDITERKLMEEQILQSQKMDSIGQLAGGVAHDFNNMLSGILGAAELLEMGLPEDYDKGHDMVRLIKTSAGRAAELTAKLLAFSRQGEPMNSPMDVHASVNDALALLERSLDKRIEVQAILSAPDSVILGDPLQIQNALLNLGINARDAMPGGGRLEITTAGTTLDAADCEASTYEVAPGTYLEITVRDTGVGMGQEVKKRIFEPFFTTKGTGKGTGLGLSAVYGTVCMHGGAISVNSAPGAGTTFRIYLPLVSDPTGVEDDVSGPIPLGTGCILVVDDEEVLRTTAAMMLEDLGYEVLLAEDGLEGVAQFERHRDRICVVILDMIMPRMGGADAFRAIRRIDPQARVIIASGFAQEEIVSALREEGLCSFIGKPYSCGELARLLDEIM